VVSRVATLYVKSGNVVTGETSVMEPYLIKKGVPRGDFYRMRDMFWGVAFGTRIEEVRDYVLPDDQKAIVEIVKKVCEKYGFEIKVVDLARENVLHRAVQEEVSKIKIFPTLITDFGGRLEGNFSEEQVESLLSRD